MGRVFVYGTDQLWNAGEHAAAQPVLGDVAKEPLNHIEAGRRSRREVHVKARMLLRPPNRCSVLVRRVVVSDQVQRLVLGRLAFGVWRSI